MIDQLRSCIEQSNPFKQLLSLVISVNKDAHIHIGGLAGSGLGFVASSLSRSVSRQVLVITPERADAEQLSDDLGIIHGDSTFLFNLRAHHRTQSVQGSPNSESLASLRALAESSVDILVTSSDSVSARLPDAGQLRSSTIRLEVGKNIILTDLVQQLNGTGFDRKDFVGEPGEFSQRGGILDVFSHASEYPIRYEFLGDMIESIREFDALSQRSIREITAATITPDLFSAELQQSDDPRNTLLTNHLKENAIILLVEPELIWAKLDEIHNRDDKEVFDVDAVQSSLSNFQQIHLQAFHNHNDRIDFNSSPQPSFNGNISYLRKHLLELGKQSVRVFIACDGQTELKRLRELITEPAMTQSSKLPLQNPISDDDIEELANIEFAHHAIHAGFLLRDSGIACYAEHQIFGRQKRRGKLRKTRLRGFTQNELQHLKKGDFVVHEDFGIGKFDGLKTIRVRTVDQEVMKLSYEEKDTLYVNLNYLNKVKKYSSKEGLVPKLTRLGTQEWGRLKARAKKRIQDIARDLIRLYAQRKSSTGYAFQPDTQWQKELEASFMYEDTFDQAKATLDVKKDMEQPFPMDRLVCGDVGFGKTEVAVRAAFKAVLDGKQVAVLVPTTILAIQHHNTFVDRTSRFTVSVDVLSRLKSKREQQEILGRTKSGALDILIGTHRILSKDVHFKELGLLIIDEEHRFGVAAKEKLRRLRSTVDTLTLTATPIPRTLHFSLMGARDLSIIATPPRNRLPIITEIAQYNEELIKEVVAREVGRGGQVYFVHDRVTDIQLWADKLRSLLPSLRIRHAHGQMHAHELEEVMLDFEERKLDVLLCTKIIESGLDIPNVNTIVINRADRFGMSELYQLKGRVGRSNIQAYAYLLVPPISVLPKTTIQRLQAIEEFTELGSGFNLSMRDLEIRGAGNLLGAEQSGFIESMGFETYTRILDEAVSELKELEFKGLFPGGEVGKRSEETVVEVNREALIPESYIYKDEERLEIYRRMYALSTQEQLLELEEEFKDRFGSPPIQVCNLLGVVQVRIAAKAIGFTKVLIGADVTEIDFPPESDASFYEGENFQALMNEISRRKKRGVQIKQDGKSLKLVVSFEGEAQLNPIAFVLNFLQELLYRPPQQNLTSPPSRSQ